jgi:hypothetical protein
MHRASQQQPAQRAPAVAKTIGGTLMGCTSREPANAPRWNYADIVDKGHQMRRMSTYAWGHVETTFVVGKQIVKMWMAAGLAALVAVAAAPQARADESAYLNYVQGNDDTQTPGAQTLLNEGYKVCGAIHERRISDTQAVDMIKSDLSISDAAAIQIYSAATSLLGC